ncbi:3'3'-cGAMP-specific phosphodiesterase 2 [Fundidesulfovibrio magnetotacticus]|uniref:3'3'-cGAMP-specific phosphodiesterase 2 n=1 Tax=Fundidesulfovibrio magnetotacticus TaxID=2730080 RepID=A0A6V8LVG0_9BACT|nr:HD domain-containing phosphohydrolase [Fundidesulfovibrio magnetotacticus]GFK94581.1 3'3'-cGAMP-specific phosphodiesterase 2 [Fundidesulfovibrio magnetotacticus]
MKSPRNCLVHGEEGQFRLDGLSGQLVKIGLALSSTRELGELLELVLFEARKMTGADAGSVYLLEGNVLRFETSHNQTLFDRLGEPNVRAMFKRFELPLDSRSIAGHVAMSKEILNIPDVNRIPEEAPYSFNANWDKANDYRSMSMLVAPMVDQAGRVVGVIQLINAMCGESVVPFDPSYSPVVAAFASQAAVAIVNAKLTSDLQDAWLDSIFRLGVAAEFRDKETSNHIKRVSEYSVLLGRHMGMEGEELEHLRWAAAMHDCGKLGIPDSILHKPGQLTPEERSTMEYHTLIGALILKGGSNPLLKASQVVALSHHEKWDGSGYPRGLAGEDIPLAGRIVAVADVFDALSSRRVYKPAFPMEKVVDILAQESGRHFDPRLVGVLFEHLDAMDSIRHTYLDTDADFEKFRNYSLLKIEDVL